MYEAEVIEIAKTKDGKYKVYLAVSYHGIEEEAIFRFDSLKELPRYLFTIEGGLSRYTKRQRVQVSHPWEDANGLVFEHMYPLSGGRLDVV